MIIGLNSLIPSYKYNSSASLKSSSLTSVAGLSYNSIGGANLSGKIKCLKDTGRTASDCSHLSEMTLMKYWGGIGSYKGTVNVIICYSVESLSLRMNYSEWRICSESLS